MDRAANPAHRPSPDRIGKPPPLDPIAPVAPLARVTSSVSKKTDYVVVGENADVDAQRFRRSSNGVCLITQPMLDRLEA